MKVGSYNKKMKTLRFLGLCIGLSALSFLTGCASKNIARAPLDSTVFSLDENAEIKQNPALTKEEFEAQQRGEVPPSFDIPVVRNAQVEQWLSYFQGRGRKWFHLWLERSGRYIPMMRKILKEHELPEDLVYLAMIESGFSPQAYSRARAMGVWQFIKSTGRLYGLKSDFWVEERRDPEKATLAAARHLKDLYDQFQSWKLAAAAYNAGPRKIEKAIKKYKTEEFWDLTKGRYLRKETRHYVPKIIAAALIAKEPEKYGFNDIQYLEPLQYDKIIIEHPVNLQTLADRAECSVEELMDVNPELNHPVTPPGHKQYELRVPSGKSQEFLEAYNSLGEEDEVQYTAHRIRRGDTLAKLSRLYSVPTSEILKMNHMKNVARLKLGSTLIMPVPLNDKLVAVEKIDRKMEPERRPRIRRARVAEVEVADSDGVHVVRRGESLFSIARRYRMSIGELKNKNNLRVNRIKPGQRLRVSDSKRVFLHWNGIQGGLSQNV